MIIPAANSKQWEKEAVRQLCEQWDGIPLDCDVTVRALIYRDSKRGDLVGYQQAIGDALQGGGSRSKAKRTPCVLMDDSQIKSFDGTRLLIDRENPRVEIEIQPFVA
jgi:Holliday junction resolvase RusA-like endonuclease